MMKYLQKLGKALMLPVACLPICGILMGIGYALCPSTMQGGDVTGILEMIGFFLVKAGGALIDNMAILFVIGVGVGMADDNDGTAGLAALASWLMMTNLLSVGTVTTLMPAIADNATKSLAFGKIANPFIGILAGIIGATCYNKFKGTKLPDWLSFFSGKRCVAIVAGVVSIIVSAILLFIWPLLFGALVAIGESIVGLGPVGAGIYAFLNRLLIPTGLHHALNNVFWFDTIGLGDLQHFWAGETSADVSWDLGMYMSGFFPCMMFGVGVGMADDNDGTAGLAALASWLMMTNLLSVGTVTTLMPAIADNATKSLAFGKIANPFIGILAGIIGATCYNKFKGTKLPDWLSFFSGKRCVAIVAGVVSIIVSAILLFIWPLLFGALVAIGESIVGLGPVGAGIYAFLNRLLIPTGLHHALNNVFWFDTIGLGDLQHFWAGETSADVSWDLGMYMSGFFPCMMFGVPGAALAMVHTAKSDKKKLAIGLVASAALCAFVCGVTEPFEFGFMFLAPALYVVYAALYGIFTVITVLVGFRAGFSFSAGATDLIFSAPLPAAKNTWMIIPLGIAAFIVFYVVFRFAITKFDLKTPGREDDDVEAEKKVDLGSSDYTTVAATILEGVGGAANVTSIDNCITRLRLEVKDSSLVDEKKIKSAGAAGVIRPSKTAVQVVVGTKVQFVADEFKKLCK